MRRLVRRVLAAYDNAGSRLRAFAIPPRTAVAWAFEPDPTVPPFIQLRLAARDAEDERTDALWRKLLGRDVPREERHVAAAVREAELDAEFAARMAELDDQWDALLFAQGLN